jgi:hypothetical protein
MFLTDTVDAADGESTCKSESIMDRLANLILEERPNSVSTLSHPLPAWPTNPPDTLQHPDSPPLELAHMYKGKRRPVLATTYKLTTIQTLCPFLLKASALAYEGVYQASKGVDWEFVEGTLEDEIFRAV